MFVFVENEIHNSNGLQYAIVRMQHRNLVVPDTAPWNVLSSTLSSLGIAHNVVRTVENRRTYLCFEFEVPEDTDE